jgi:hypothetical protein
MIGRLDRRRVGRPAAMLLCGLVCCSTVAFSRPAAAQVTGFNTNVALPANPNPTIAGSNLVIGNQVFGTLNPSNPVTYDGQSGQGFFVTAGSSLTINNSVLQNAWHPHRDQRRHAQSDRDGRIDQLHRGHNTVIPRNCAPS